MIAIHGVGFDRIDLPEVRRRGIAVTCTPEALTDDVADLAVGLLMALLRRIPAADRYVREVQWGAEDFPLATRVTGKRFGIVGLGRIGTAIARRLEPFGPIAYNSRVAKQVPWAYHPTVASLAAASDVLVVACAADERTKGLIGRHVLEKLGESGYLINVARGSVVDEAALGEQLASGRLSGAALDVFVDEPMVPTLLRGRSTVLSPHVASATVEAREEMARMVLESVDAFLAGKTPPHQITAAATR